MLFHPLQSKCQALNILLDGPCVAIKPKREGEERWQGLTAGYWEEQRAEEERQRQMQQEQQKADEEKRRQEEAR